MCSMLPITMVTYPSSSFPLFHVFLTLFMLLVLQVNSVSFRFPQFNSNTPGIFYENDSYAADPVIQLTANRQDSSLGNSVGRASYSESILLWEDSSSGDKKITDFSTHFSFNIKEVNATSYGDGMSFFLTPFESRVPQGSTGGYLGLVTPESYNITSNNTFVAVEFDTYGNSWDPSNNHVGIDVNSIVSVANVTWRSSIKNGSTAQAWVTYDSTTKNLSVFLTYDDTPVFSGNSSLSYIVDLSTILPRRVRVGFSASTGAYAEIHNLRSWEFNSTLEDSQQPMPTNNSTGTPSPGGKGGLIGGIVSGIGVLAMILGLIGFMMWRKKRRSSGGGNDDIDFGMDDNKEFEMGTGPKRFTYRELSQATRKFSEEGKLGEGGFGGVYIGLLTNPSREIAVKRVSKGSKQGKKEYASEVRIISRVRHRNLVQLLGWCHDMGELLLVYEFMPNGSLDSHLYVGSNKPSLSWTTRNKIALGLASALLYLHEEWEQCVVHRDVKASNVMLDSNFNTKLGDFGLARLVDHDMGSQTTVVAGTLGYLAPECMSTGKSTKESDVYSFGVVALEIACGRRPIEYKEETHKVRMVEWVWDLYGRGSLLEAVDKRLEEGEFDVDEIERLMVVGLWCCHPEYTIRPSIRQVISVLNGEASLPSLPAKFPVPVYSSFPMNMDILNTTSSGFTGSSNYTTSSSSRSVVSGTAPLLSQRADV